MRGFVRWRKISCRFLFCSFFFIRAIDVKIFIGVTSAPRGRGGVARLMLFGHLTVISGFLRL